jgi:UDP-glucose 4-epimerase
MRALVTGGAGFIGSHMVERLLSDRHQVVVLDNYSTGRPENLAHLGRAEGLQVVTKDVADGSELATHFEGVEWVFHLAGLADIVPSIQHPQPYHRSNVDGTVNVLEAARATGVKRFIYAASSSCYGIPEAFPTPETAAIRPQYPYALTKYVGEQYVLHWGRVYKLPVISLRLFNVYGLRSRTSGAYGAVFGVFLAQKLAQQPFTVVGDGTQTRDFTFVTDVVRAFMMAVQSDVVGEVFNVGSGSTHSINRLVDLMGGDVVRMPKRPGEPDCTYADISKIRRTLGWEPTIPLEIGVAALLENIDYWRDAPLWTPTSIAAATSEWHKHLGE